MPFGGDELNPTERVLAALPGEIGGYAVKKLLLPVEFGRAAMIACSEYDALSPAAVIMLGQAGGRSAITPEAVGRNLMNARIPDNAGFSPVNEAVIPGGAEELSSTLPLDAIVSAIRGEGLAAEISRDAGAYVCNSLLYSMLAHVSGSVPAGFIHVPFIREQVEGVAGRGDTPFMEEADILCGIIAAIRAVTGSIG
ncbi:MAG: pyroglutamyl-peptidase I [Clostridia bacterium]|nr:pyroglutamyl-peptidase I [Clostridia bacterium]